MNKKTLQDLSNIEGKVVLTRVDFNVPIKEGVITDTNRISAALPTIQYLLDKKSKVVLFTHLGRIDSEKSKDSKSVKIIAQKLVELSGWKVKFISETRGKKLEEAISNMKNSTIIMVENTRFEDVVNGKIVKNESKNNSKLGKYWASLGDVFVNDAFGTAHRSHASNVGIASNIKESSIGFLIEKEIKFLHNTISNPKRPFVVLLGGAKVSDKINVIEKLVKKADKVIIGTAMCYTFHLAMKKNIGNSLAEPNSVNLAKKLMKKYGDKLIITKDSNCSPTFADVKGEIHDEVPNGMIGMDAGPKTIKLVKKELKGAKTVVWNGPFGVSEFDNFKYATQTIAKTIAKLKGATTIIGGGDSAAAVISMGLSDKFSHVSTGGGASMEFLEGKVLPGIDVIQEK
ncbi:MAG: phosphoglycerate kinase [Mycoplasmataceae bacterium]|nr:phosphoglycerate kinase [Mycoplasmataceae bacterium]